MQDIHRARFIRLSCLSWLLVFFMFSDAYGEDANPKTVESLRGMNYVVVSPRGPGDGGDFGPNTPNSKTSGIQEALDFAKANSKDVYIAGGAMPKAFAPGASYSLHETLRISCFQNFRLDGGEYVLQYDQSTGDAIVIDSLMSSRLKFGIIVSQSDGAVVRVRPQTKGPDGFTVVIANTLEFNALVGGGSVYPDHKQAPKGIGLYLDGSEGPIVSNKIYATEIIACDKGLYLSCGNSPGKSAAIVDNIIEVPFAHLCATHLHIGDATPAEICKNTLLANINSEGIEGSIGARIFAKTNLFTLSFAQTAPNKNIVFEAPALDNQVTVMNFPNGYTNNAEHPTNRIVSVKPIGFAVPTPDVPPSGTAIVNRNPYTIEVLILSSGSVSGWTLKDANGTEQTISAGLSSGQTISLEPGDAIQVEYTKMPAWRWRAVR